MHKSYDQMKDSGVEWIGEIPKHWETATLKRLSRIQTGNTPPKQAEGIFYSEYEGIPWIKADNLGTNNCIEKTAEYLTEQGADAARINPENTVYVCCIGSIGKAGYSTQKCACNQQINAVVFNSLMWWKFGFYSILAQEAQHWFYANGNVLKILNSENQKRINVALPPLEEQKAIAVVLDKKNAAMDEIIAEAKATIEEYKAWKASVIFEAVTKGLDPNAEMKDSGFDDIGKIPTRWKIVRIKHRYDVICGATPSDDTKNWDGDIAWIGPADMEDFGKIKGGKRTISKIGYESCATTLLPVGSVVLSTRAPIGKIQITGDSLCTNQGCKSLVKKDNADSCTFLAYYLFSIKERLQEAGTGTTFTELSTSALKNMPLTLPPPFEQAAIAAYLDDKCEAIDSVIAKKEALIADMESYKKSLIFECVTGKRKVC